MPILFSASVDSVGHVEMHWGLQLGTSGLTRVWASSTALGESHTDGLMQWIQLDYFKLELLMSCDTAPR